MCYSGWCTYENYYGDCTLGYRRVYPADADCMVDIDVLSPQTAEHEDGAHEE